VEPRNGACTSYHLANGVGTHQDRLSGEDYAGVGRPIGHHTVHRSVGGGQRCPSPVRPEQVPRGGGHINPGLTACQKEEQTSNNVADKSGHSCLQVRVSGGASR
jgi:hypothetical protein